MESNRFDDLTRALGGGQSRRRMLKALGGAALAAAGLTRIDGAEAAACKSPNVRCGKGKDAICADLQTDEANCGACGNVCGADGTNETCCDGVCTQVTGAGAACCSDAQCGDGMLCHSSYHICFTPPWEGQCGIGCTRDVECNSSVGCICNPSSTGEGFGFCWTPLT
jgi:hypothetical protein